MQRQGNQPNTNRPPPQHFRTRVQIPLRFPTTGRSFMIIHQLSQNPNSNNLQQSLLPITTRITQNNTETIYIPLNLPSTANNTVSRGDEIVPHEGLFSEALEPKIDNEFYNLGVSHFKNKEYYLALQNFEKAFKKQSNSIFLANMAVCYKKAEAWTEALETIKRAISMEEKDGYLHFAGKLAFNLAKINNDEAHIVDALDKFRLACELNASTRNKSNYLLLRKIFYSRHIKKQLQEKRELVEYLNSGNRVRRKLRTKTHIKNKNTLESGTRHLKKVGLAEMDSNQRSLGQFCECVISMEPFQTPVVTNSGNSFEKAHFEEHCRHSGFSDPISRQKFQNMGQVFPNKTLERLIFDFCLKAPWKFKSEVDYGENEFVWKFAQVS